MGTTRLEIILKNIYYNLASSASYAGVNKILAEAKKIDSSITQKNVREFLKRQRIYTMHKPARKRFKRLKTVPSGLHTDWQCDLAIFDKLKDENDGYLYLLVCIDTLSRKIFATPTKSKRSVDMIEAFGRIFQKSKYKPWKLMSDRGVEFTSKEMLKFFQNNGIIKYSMYSPNVHAAMVERANRTIKERLYKYMFEKDTLRWVDKIDLIVNNINNSINRITGHTPNQVDFETADIIRDKLYKGVTAKLNRSKYKIGDLVRIPIKKGIFGKGYFPNYSDEIFRIFEVKYSSPVTYTLEDSDGNLIAQKFYESQLSPTSDETTYRIEKILKTRKTAGFIEYFVKWRGYSDKHNSWVEAGELNFK